MTLPAGGQGGEETLRNLAAPSSSETHSIEAFSHLSNLETKCYDGPTRPTNPMSSGGVLSYQHSYHRIRFRQLDNRSTSTEEGVQVHRISRQPPYSEGTMAVPWLDTGTIGL